MSLKRSNPLAKLAEDEEAFVLRGQDMAAPATICFWITANIENSACSDEKLLEALTCALRMRKMSFRRAAD